MHYAMVNDTRLAYSDEGVGSPILLMHGFTGTARSHFAGLIDILRVDYRVIAPDLRGYGASQPPGRDFPPDFYRRDADDMAALIDTLGIGPVTVLGFSDGGESALLLAAQRPDLVRAVLAWGVAGVIAPAMLAQAEQWLPLEAWEVERAEWRAEIIANHGAAQFAPMICGWLEAIRAIVAAGGNICLAEAEQITCPTLLINGANEVGNPLADVQRLAARIPNCRLEIVAESGHGVHWEQPQRFIALTREFLGQVTA